MTKTNYFQNLNTKKALAALALTLAMIIPYMLLADTREPSCSGNPPDRDCDGAPGCESGRPCARTNDLDDRDPQVGSACSSNSNLSCS